MPGRVLRGKVLSDKCDKTLIVRVDRKVRNSKYRKTVTKSRKYAAHDEENKFKIGDNVQIKECRPVSKNKCWQVIVD